MKTKNHHKLSNYWSFVIFGILFFTISSCVNGPLFDQNKEVDNTWSPAEKLNFQVDVKDTISPFDFYINIRNSTDYKYSNLYFFMKTIFPNKQIAIDTIECYLADNQGNWLGKGFGKYRDQQILFKRNGRFPMSGIYQIQIEQATRDINLIGIKAIGIRIEKYVKKQ